MPDPPKRRIRLLTAAVLATAIAEALVQLAYFNSVPPFQADFGIHVGLGLGALWALLTLAALVRHGSQARWLLWTALLVFLMPASLVVALLISCSLGVCL